MLNSIAFCICKCGFVIQAFNRNESAIQFCFEINNCFLLFFFIQQSFFFKFFGHGRTDLRIRIRNKMHARREENEFRQQRIDIRKAMGAPRSAWGVVVFC